MAIARIRKIGNSLGLILPREFLRATSLQRGDEIEIGIVHGNGDAAIAIRKINTIT